MMCGAPAQPDVCRMCHAQQEILIREGVLQGCNWGSLYFDLTYTEHVLKPLIEKLAGSGAMPVCIHDDSMTVADPKGACHMMDQLQELGTST